MPEIIPFKAIHYTQENKDLLTTQPYDRISDEMQDVYYKRHEHNLIRLIKGKNLQNDNEVQNKYIRARNYFADWLQKGILKEEDDPALYAYYQTYNVRGETKTRKGLTCMVRIHPLGDSIHPHESTHIAPKEDRFRLLLQTETFFEHVFMLYTDASRRVVSTLDGFTNGKPLMRCKDDLGEIHTVWKISDKKAIDTIRENLYNKDLIIADGHHRYEATLRLNKETGSVKYILATLFNTEEELYTLATHRAIFDCSMDLGQFIGRVSEFFTVTPYRTDEESIREFLEDIRIEGMSLCSFGLVTQKGLFLLVLRGKTDELDVNILHQYIFNKLLDITPEDLDREKKVHFYRSEEDVMRRTFKGEYVASFLVNPVKINQVKILVKQGRRFPQKTTDFYPKLVSGLLMARFK